jgi:hypothetical protein
MRPITFLKSVFVALYAFGVFFVANEACVSISYFES